MAYAPVDLYRDVLPQTNCQDCGLLSCLAFAAKVISEVGLQELLRPCECMPNHRIHNHIRAACANF